MKIVIGYDGSKTADAAVDEVLKRPWPPGSEVRIVTVVPVFRTAFAADGMAYYGPVWEKAVAAARENAHGRIKNILERFRAHPDLKASYEIRDETPTVALLDVIKRWGADLLVLGSQGTTAMGRLFVGSVCHAMVSHAPCAVEIIRPPHAA